MAGSECVGYIPKVDDKLRYYARLEHLLTICAVPIAGADDAVAERDRSAVGVDVDQFGGEVGVVVMLSNAVGVNFQGMVSSTSFDWDDDLFAGEHLEGARKDVVI